MGNISGVKKWLSVLVLLVVAVVNSFSQDVTPPPPTTIRSVDVNPANNNITITWNPSTAVDAAKYRIYKVINGYNTLIDSVNVPTTTYTHNFVPPGGIDSSHANPNFWSETFMVTATDGVNESLLSLPHKTIFLERIFYPCYGQILLNWSAYVGWDVLEYQIFASLDGGSYQLIGTVDGNTNTYKHRHVEADVTYVYYIKAIMLNGNYNSRSNAVSVYTDMPTPPDFINANYATVLQENIIRLEFLVDTYADEVSYKILRNKENSLVEFDTIVTKYPADVQAGMIITYDDVINTDEVHYYKLAMINTCQVPFDLESNICSNILVSAKPNINLVNDITWSNYQEWLGGVSHYEVHRVIGKDDVRIAVIPYGDSTYSDDMKDFFQNPLYSINFSGNDYNPNNSSPNEYIEQPIVNGQVCYYIKGIEDDNNPYGVTGRSSSNVFCMDLNPIVWIPNAFTPNSDGNNDFFMPFVTYVGWSNYQMRIFNRFGAVMFETTNPRTGWDGRNLKGEAVPPGNYVYLIKVTSSDGKTSEYQGPVTLLK